METIAVVVLVVLAAVSIGVFVFAYNAWRNRETEESLKDAEAADAFDRSGGGGPKPRK